MNSVAPGRARVRLAATLASIVAVVACVVLLILLATSSRQTGSQKLASDRSSAASVANAFIMALGTYDRSLLQGTTMPAYRAKVEALLTPKFGVAFENSGAPKAEQAVGKASLKETVKIWATGVAAINEAQATVLVVGALTDYVPKTPGGTDYQSLGETPFRTVVTLVKDGTGTWLVDGQAPAEGIPPLASGSPSTPASPTSGASK